MQNLQSILPPPHGRNDLVLVLLLRNLIHHPQHVQQLFLHPIGLSEFVLTELEEPQGHFGIVVRVEGFGAGGEFGGVEGEFGAVFGEAIAGVFEVEDGAVEGGDGRFFGGGGGGFGFAMEATHGGGIFWLWW
ncbi:hypothetical protein ACHAXS_009948 [Conticribra weissflogii]